MLAALGASAASSATPVGPVLIETKEEMAFSAGKGKRFRVALKPEWGVLTLRTRMKTTDLVPGKDPGWMNGRIPMSFHGKDGKMVGGWPNVFGFAGTRDWTDCVRDFPIPEGAVALNLGLNNFGTAGTVEFGPMTLTVKRNRTTVPCNAPLPEGVLSGGSQLVATAAGGSRSCTTEQPDPWSLADAWKVSTATRARYCLNGLWGVRPALSNDAPDAVPGPQDNWGWGKIPSIWGAHQHIVLSDWFEDHGVRTEIKDRAWYRRDFTMPPEAAGKRVVLTFTMLQTRAVVYVDGARAAEVTFPGGEADITQFVKPGKKQSIALDVTAYPLNPETLDFNAPDRAVTKKSEVRFKGVTGDVYLDVMPKDGPRIVDATVESDVAGGNVTFVAELAAGTAAPHTGGSRSCATVRLVAKISDLDGKLVREFASGALTPDADGRVAFTAAWSNAKRWDTHTPGNRYVCKMELWRAAVSAAVATSCDPPVSVAQERDPPVDAALPFEFGFREIRAEGRDLKLNGTTIHLRALYNRTTTSQAAVACRASALELVRRLKSEGYNFIIAGNYNFSPGAVGYMDALLDVCDETGMLYSFSLPHVRDFGMKLDDPATAARYRALAQWCVRRARNHPSVVSYAMNHNCTGYSGDMNPLRIDGIYDPAKAKERSFRNRDQARLAAAIARSLDGTRPIYHHESGNLDDFHTVNIYLNWAPVQERSDWLEHWSREGVKPLFFVEWGMPHISSWSSYRGPLFIWRSAGYQSLWASEFAAALRGDAAYEGDTPETVKALRHEEDLWAQGKPFFWGKLNQPLRALTNNYQGVQALYMADNWRSHRAWGISAMLPWDQEAFHVRTGASTGGRENPARWEGLKSPGIVPDILVDDGWDTGTGNAESYARSCVGKVITRWNMPDCAFIGGDGVFTDKRHHYRTGETVKKTLVVLNDRRVPQEVSWACELVDGRAGARPSREGRAPARPPLRGTVTVAPGGRADVPVSFTLPGRAGRYTLAAEFRFADGVTQRDAFALDARAPVATPTVKNLLVYDPKGLTTQELQRLGIAAAPTDLSDVPPDGSSLVIGREALTRDLLDRVLVPAARRKCRILVFEQDKTTLESLGFRVQAYGLRQAFPRFADWALGFALTADDLRDWCGESTLLPPYLTNVPETEANYRSDTWAGFRNTRVWRCRLRGAVASVIPEKPSVGDWRALCDGGFDLQYAPLLDWRIEQGCITFCQLDVTGRTVVDPVADDLVRRLVARLAQPLGWPKWPRAIGQRAWIAGRDRLIGIKQNPDERDSGVYVVSSGAERPADFFDQIARGGRALCLGLTAEEVKAWSPVPLAVAETNGCYASRVEKIPPELNGLSNADWSWHGAMDFAAFTDRVPDGNSALRVVRHGKGWILFWQVPPWKIDAEAKPYLRTSRRRAEAMLARLFGNLGCVSLVGSVLYSDTPVPEDDPYRYYRW